MRQKNARVLEFWELRKGKARDNERQEMSKTREGQTIEEMRKDKEQNMYLSNVRIWFLILSILVENSVMSRVAKKVWPNVKKYGLWRGFCHGYTHG